MRENESQRSPAHQPVAATSRDGLKRAGLIVLAILLFAVGALGAIYSNLVGSLRVHDIASYIDNSNRPDGNTAPVDQKAGDPINILVIGSDSRAGYANTSQTVGMRSDTTMLVHISADRSRVDVVSIPRDTLVDIPPCKLPDGTMTEAQSSRMFNRAFSIGGSTDDVAAAAACSVSTTEQLTGVYIDGYAVINFAGFENIVNTLGGVEMCITEPINDSKADLTLDAGCQNLDGETALKLARARYSLGDGSDIGRIGRQQELVSSIVTKALDQNLFTDMPTLYRLIQDLTASMDLSSGIGDVRWIAGLAGSLQNLSSDDINFVTMPFSEAGARVVPNERSQIVWDALKEDTPIPDDALNSSNLNKSILSGSGTDALRERAGSGFAILEAGL